LLSTHPIYSNFRAKYLCARAGYPIRMRKTVLITGGAGFIGSHFTEYLLARYPDYEVRVLDALTYAGRRENLAAVEGDPRFTFIHGDMLKAAGSDLKVARFVRLEVGAS